jgi:hypothetical protein
MKKSTHCSTQFRLLSLEKLILPLFSYGDATLCVFLRL